MDRIIQYIPILFFLFLWEIASLLVGSDRVPSVLQVFDVLFRSLTYDTIIESQGGGQHGFAPHILSTIKHLVLGLGFGGAVGLIIAFTVFHSSIISNIFGPMIEVVRAMPPLIVVPFVLLLAGPTETGQIVVGSLYAAFSIFVYARNALENVHSQYRIIGEIYGATLLQVIKTIEIPAILPEMVGGLRVTVSLTLGIVVVAEYLGAPSGIGRVLKFAISFASVELIVVGIVWAALIGTLVDFLVGYWSKSKGVV